MVEDRIGQIFESLITKIKKQKLGTVASNIACEGRAAYLVILLYLMDTFDIISLWWLPKKKKHSPLK
jgi:hypothetical protein